MKHSIFTFLFFFIAAPVFCQSGETKPKLNLGFEQISNGIPVGWNNFSSAENKISLDSTVVKSGRYSASIEYSPGDDFKALAFILPDNYNGKIITLSGYIKTENVSDGYAGLWMRIDPDLGFENMNNDGIKGTTDWKKYEIALQMNPGKTKQIVIGGLLVGKGKMWMDDLQVTIDGKDINDLKPYQRKIFPAENDKEFDKGSKIGEITPDKNKIENLKMLGLVWGFLKYYHPAVAAGNFNWDYELFRVLPKVLNAENKSDLDKILVNWINQLGKFDPGKKSKIKSEIKFEPDLEWIRNSNFSDELVSSLLKVKNAARPDEHYYIGLFPMVGNPEFKNENPYASMKFPDAGYRLLALYRYWNMIQYWYPYKNLIGADWKNVLDEFIPRVLDAKDLTGYTLTFQELIARIHDTHANIWGKNEALNNYFGLNHAAVECSFVEGKAVVTGFYNADLGKETGLEKGDVISKINNKPVEDIVKEKLKISPASNYPTQLRDISRELLRTNDSVIILEFIRNNQKGNKTLKAYSSKELNVRTRFFVTDTCFRFITKDIAVINNGSLKTKWLPELWKQIQNTKGLIIDDRNYPSDFPIFELGNLLMSRSTPFVKFTNGNIKTPGLFTFTKSINVGKRNRHAYTGKVVILVNEISQSSAEYHAMAYRACPNATVIGSTTAGADGNVSQIWLPGGISTMISGIGIYYPDGRETQRVGIVPDIEVKPTIEGIKSGRDEVLERAVGMIEGKK
jgi:C-terminal processing protease CtpA/Prc